MVVLVLYRFTAFVSQPLFSSFPKMDQGTSKTFCHVDVMLGILQKKKKKKKKNVDGADTERLTPSEIALEIKRET